jgi:hypothetical protein
MRLPFTLVVSKVALNLLLSVILLHLTCNGLCQSIVIKQIELEGSQINIYYDLNENNNLNVYTITLHSSVDNFNHPLKFVTGDVGFNVKPGTDKKVYWDAGAEMGPDFSSRVSFEIRGSIVTQFLQLNENYNEVKRGKLYTYTWLGPIPAGELTMELIQGEVKTIDLPPNTNPEEYQLKLPTSVKPGRLYRLKISKTGSSGAVYSNEFSVRRKVPFALKAVPILVLGAATYFLIKDNGDEKLPDPIKP